MRYSLLFCLLCDVAGKVDGQMTGIRDYQSISGREF